MKRVISILLTAIILCISSSAFCMVTVSAAETQEVEDINLFGYDTFVNCNAMYLEELNSGTVVYEHYASNVSPDPKQLIYPASTTKVMTYIVVEENVADLDGTMIEITYDALADLDPESSVMGLEYHVGESFSVRDLLYGLMLPSGNDAALVLAQYVGGSVSGFVDMMNRKAAQLGCTGTHFTSPHGLHDAQHYTTLRDLATITKYALNKKNSSFMEICNTVTYKPEGFNNAFKTTNYLLDSSVEDGKYYYPYAKGIKTGYTDEAGKCLISTAEKDGCRYLCLAIGADYSYYEDVNYAMLDTKAIYEWAFDTLAIQDVYSTEDVIKSVPVQYVWGNKMLNLVPEHDISALLPKDYKAGSTDSTVTYKVNHKFNLLSNQDSVAAPIQKGEVYDTITVTLTITQTDPDIPDSSKEKTIVLGTTNLVAAESIEADSSNKTLHKVAETVENHLVLFIVLGLVLIIGIVLLVRVIKRNKARKQRRARARINRGE